jgi:hypothetical protein
MKNLTLYLLIVSLFGIALFCNVGEILEKPPMSIHIWRQADCLSLTKNYSENLNFFEPSIHNFISEDRTSGKTVGEFPILYYFVGAIWKTFGESVYFYRTLGLLIFILGVLYLYRTTLILSESKFWSFFIAIIFFSSPGLFYYSLNFITNTYSLSCVLIAWYFVVKYLKKERLKDLIFFSFLFLLAGLLKVTALISLIALIGGLLINSLITKKLSKAHQKLIISFVFIIAIISIWFYWAESYNNKYGGKYTFNSIWPIWEMNKEAIENAVTFAKEFIYTQMFNRFTWGLIWLCFLVVIIQLKKLPIIISTLLILFLGCIIYSVLWFSAFNAHDYYIINLMILPLSIIVIGLILIKNNSPQILENKNLKITGSLILIYNIIFLSTNIHLRYHDRLWNDNVTSNFFISKFEKKIWDDHIWVSHTYDGLDRMVSYNRSIGIKPEDLIIFIPDGTFNASLFLLQQKGWTSFGGNYTFNEDGINQKIEKNAKYLIITDRKIVNPPNFLIPFLNNKVGEFEGREVFNLQK